MLKRSTLKKYARRELLERFEDGRPIYFHTARCESFCDFACNGRHGSEIAGAIEAMEKKGTRDARRHR